MAEHGLFIGWGAARPGKEVAASSLFMDAVAYWNSLKASGEIEALDLAFLDPHGGDLGGFALLEGDADKLARLRTTEEFQRLMMRGGVCLDHLGVVDAMVGPGVMHSMEQWNQVVADLV